MTKRKRGKVMDFRSSLVMGGVSACVLLLLGCGSARRGEPLVGPSDLSPEQSSGRLVFYTHCNQCHPGGEAGVGPALNNKPLPGWMIKMQVRHGLGAMPSFSNIRIPERDLDHLVSYVKELRRKV
jgi:mono/diheme cytochrome c family protein